MKRAYFWVIGGLLLAAGAVLAQTVPLQSGNWTAGNVPKYNGFSNGQPVLVDSGLPPGSPNVTEVADLPTCDSPATGLLYVVTDALSPTYGAALTGGGSVVVLALCNGSGWRAH